MKKKPTVAILRLMSGLIVIAAVALQPGCVAVAAGAGAGAVAYIRGDLEATLECSLAAAAKASERAVSRLEFVKIGDRRDALSAQLTARTARDKKVEIILTKVSDGVTRVKIRVGVFGDEAISLAVLEQIKAAL